MSFNTGNSSVASSSSATSDSPVQVQKPQPAAAAVPDSKLWTTLEIKLVQWKLQSEKLMIFIEGAQSVPQRKKRVLKPLILVITAVSEKDKKSLALHRISSFVTKNGATDYKLEKSSYPLKHLHTINDDQQTLFTHDEQEEDDNTPSTNNDDNESTTSRESDFSYPSKFAFTFVLRFSKNLHSIHFCVESLEQKSSFLCRLLELQKEYHGALPDLQNSADVELVSLYNKLRQVQPRSVQTRLRSVDSEEFSPTSTSVAVIDPTSNGLFTASSDTTQTPPAIPLTAGASPPPSAATVDGSTITTSSASSSTLQGPPAVSSNFSSQQSVSVSVSQASRSSTTSSSTVENPEQQKRMEKLRIVLELKLLSWKLSNEKLLCFVRGGEYFFAKKQERIRKSVIFITVDTNAKRPRLKLYRVSETVHRNGVIDYKMMRPVHKLSNLLSLHGGEYRQKDDIDRSGSGSNEGPGSDHGDMDSEEEGVGEEVDYSTSAAITIPQQRFGHKFTLCFIKKTSPNIVFGTETPAEKNEFLCDLIEHFKDHFKILPELESFTNGPVLALYNNLVEQQQQQEISLQQQKQLEPADHPPASSDPSQSGVPAPPQPEGKETPFSFHPATQTLQWHLYEQSITGLFGDVCVEYLGKSKILHRLILYRSLFFRNIIQNAEPAEKKKGKERAMCNISLDALFEQHIPDAQVRAKITVDAVETVFRYLYTNCDSGIDDSNVEGIKAVAELFQVPAMLSATISAIPVQPEAESSKSQSENASPQPGPILTEEADTLDDEDDGFPSMAQVPPTEIFSSTCEQFESVAARITFPGTSTKKLYTMFIKDDTDMLSEYHSAKGDWDVSVGPWGKSPDNVGQTRNITFRAIVQTPLGKKTGLFTETNRLLFFNKKREMIVQHGIYCPDMPYGTCYRTHSFFHTVDVLDSDGKVTGCATSMHIAPHFIKKVAFRRTIEDIILKEATLGAQTYMQIMEVKLQRSLRQSSPEHLISEENRQPDADTSSSAASSSQLQQQQRVHVAGSSMMNSKIFSPGELHQVSLKVDSILHELKLLLVIALAVLVIVVLTFLWRR